MLSKRLMISILCFPLAAVALDRSQLSPEARTFVPSDRRVVVTLKTGENVEGSLVMDAPDKLVLRVQITDTITGSKSIMKSDIRATREADVSELFSTKLLELDCNPEKGIPPDQARQTASLMKEFLDKCKGAKNYDEVQRRHDVMSAHLKKIESGMELIAGAWHSPVSATVTKYDLYTKLMQLLSKQRDFAAHRETYNRMEQERRALARALPKLMQDRIPTLMEKKQFDEAVSEVTAFLQFFVAKAIPAEGELKNFFQEVDFDYIVRMEKRIMKAYTDAGLGTEGAGGMPADQNMIFVPGGYFLMGREDAKPTEADFPMHIVYVSPFLIDKYEVTNQEYRKFVEHVKQTGDSSMEHSDAPPLKKHDAEGWNNSSLAGDAQPVVGVDWFDAYAFAKWSGKRLPTEAEWEKAARSMDGRKYPWGNDGPSGCAINAPSGRQFIAAEMDRQNPPKPVKPKTKFGCGGCVRQEIPPPPPTSLPQATWEVDKSLPPQALKAIAGHTFRWDKEFNSPYQVFHMAGNAAEWVYDLYSDKYYAISEIDDPDGPDKSPARVFRGGSYMSGNTSEFMTTFRSYPRDAKTKAGCASRGGAGFIGFRCAKSAGPRRAVREKPVTDQEMSLEDLKKVIDQFEMAKDKKRAIAPLK